MSATTKTSARARLCISASIIFSSRELKQYRRWQRLYTTLDSAQHGYVPTAIEYEEFQQWLRKQDSGYFSDIFEDVSSHVQPIKSGSRTCTIEPPVAYLCRHRMHPFDAGTLKPRCPVCTIDVHLNYMNVLTRTLQGAGGRAPSCTLQASEHQENVYQVWSLEKLSTVQQLSKLEQLAEQEAQWSANHPEQKYEDIKTARHALELYWSEMGTCKETKLPKKKIHSVSFTKDTEDGPGRPQEYYWRRSPRYESGKYTVSKSDEEQAEAGSRHVFGQHREEEDNVSEDSEDYSQAPGLRDDDSFDEVPDDDGDSDWEDIESDDEDGKKRNGVERDYVFFEEMDECNFVVFGED
ncbi:hypothetical protein P153DRAFT_332636 [Dothidotthia symphoricarpi CBS 119687]|uniref:Uncharacterized protein n=1 Tax=Dothidotthia symphoricarpi CBS 119687 TaxID=1392245 RepID=A0A6A6ANQ7_9PLEO|nr:uncharacterized protein P153DRAFT_332636 [Dothidotthia symphoricarpi CBS 119687]KAF2133632.1 hypothetical protein P153DRAFT_332636 [Dothidotthia symphoricarpi CBS 119687]